MNLLLRHVRTSKPTQSSAKKRRGTGTDVTLNKVIAITVRMINVDGTDDGGGSDNDNANDGSDLCLGLGSRFVRVCQALLADNWQRSLKQLSTVARSCLL